MTQNKKGEIFGVSHKTFLWIIVIFAFLVRAVAASSFFFYLDLEPWNIPWAKGMSENPFTGYARISNLDYPPLFPMLLGIIGHILNTPTVAANESLIMFFIKLIPMLFDIGNVILFYFIGNRYSEKVGIFAAAFWAINPSLIFNVSYWGQTDSILIFLLAITFYFLETDRPGISTIFFALACLTKLQAVYFAILFVLRLFQKYPIKEALISLIKGILVGILGWLPFMIGSKELMLPFRIYLKGFGSYPYANLNAYNLYGIGKNNFVTWDKSIIGGTFDPEKNIFIGGLTYHMVGTFFLVAIFMGLVFLYVWNGDKKKDLSSYPVGLCFANLIFMLTSSQHERYQIPVLAFAMLCWLYYQTKPYFFIISSLTVITLINQLSLVFKYQFSGFYHTVFDVTQVIFSICNVILMFYIIYNTSKSLGLLPVNHKKAEDLSD